MLDTALDIIVLNLCLSLKSNNMYVLGAYYNTLYMHVIFILF